jgi:hypothetical protein
MILAMGARRRARLSRIAAIVLLAVLVPSALYMGHWPFLPGFQRSGNAAEAHAHAGHCHAGPSKCSDGPASADPVLPEPGALAMIALGLLLLMWGQPLGMATNPLSERIKRPPRRTSGLFAA